MWESTCQAGTLDGMADRQEIGESRISRADEAEEHWSVVCKIMAQLGGERNAAVAGWVRNTSGT